MSLLQNKQLPIEKLNQLDRIELMLRDKRLEDFSNAKEFVSYYYLVNAAKFIGFTVILMSIFVVSNNPSFVYVAASIAEITLVFIKLSFVIVALLLIVDLAVLFRYKVQQRKLFEEYFKLDIKPVVRKKKNDKK